MLYPPCGLFTKPPVLIYSAVYREVFPAGALERVLSGYELGKPSEVWRIMSTHMSSFVSPSLKYPLFTV